MTITEFVLGDHVRLIGTDTIQTVRQYNPETLEYQVQIGTEEANVMWVSGIYLELAEPAKSLPSARAFDDHGVGTRNRTYGSSNLVPRIFVVDDEQVIASTLAAILKMHGYSATFFTSPVEALAAAQLDTPDLLVSDVAMPALSGIDLAIQMTAKHPACKILLLSAHAATQDLLENTRNQGYDFRLLLKPVHPTELLYEIETITIC
jgi:CheY-like chemotaxis protein